MSINLIVRHKQFRHLLPFLSAALLVMMIAALAPWLAPQDPYAQDLSQALQPPGGDHLLGTDRYGRDMLSRIIVGSQSTLLASLSLLFVIVIIGSLIGTLCGWRGGWLDTLLMRLSDVFLAFPQLVFAIAVAAVLGGGLFYAAMALMLISWPKYARIARGLTMTQRSMPYMEAARMAGSSDAAILWYHVLPNIAGPMLVTAALDLGTIIMELAGLSFLGLGAMPPTAEWGSMMGTGRSMIQTAPWVVLGPGMAIFLTVAVFNLLGDALRDYMSKGHTN